jgi:hypothetical protein
MVNDNYRDLVHTYEVYRFVYSQWRICNGSDFVCLVEDSVCEFIIIIIISSSSSSSSSSNSIVIIIVFLLALFRTGSSM